MRHHRRTAIVSILAAIAVLVPSLAWWATGSAEAERQAAEQLQEVRSEWRLVLESSAGRLGVRLESLRASEDPRPFYHYNNLYHEPRGASRGLSVVPSPLSSGAMDPLVGVHFQVDERAHVSLPAVNERFPELSSEAGYAAYCSFLRELEAGVVVAGFDDQRPWSGELAGERLVSLDASAWQQIRAADEVYAAIKGLDDINLEATVGPSGGGDVIITVGELLWHTVVTPSGPILAALREVQTPDGVLIQGFTIASDVVTVALARPGLDLRLVEQAAAEEMLTPVGSTGWQLVTGTEAMTADLVAAQDVVARFRRRFAFTTLAALLAAAAVVGLVAEANRLALQRTRFAAAAAHELRTPLAALRLYSEMLSDGLGDPANQDLYAERIAAETARLGRVVGNILDLSRLERSSLAVSPEPGDLAAVVRPLVEGLVPVLGRHGLELQLEVAENLPTVRFDGDAVCQIVANLLDNAERHTRGSQPRQAEVSIERGDQGFVSLSVTDSGPGVATAQRRRLFVPFAHGHQSDSSGLGLGLALGRSLARAQGGELTLEPKVPDSGARFTLVLPIV